MNWFLLLAAVAVGSVLPLQGALNARLGAMMIHPMQATLVSYIGGTIACIVAGSGQFTRLEAYKRD